MNLQQAYDRLNFWVNKYTGSWYSPEECDAVVDLGQMALYSDLEPQYATSQRIKDALAPFKQTWEFTPSNTISGIIPVPINLNLISLKSVTIEYGISGRTLYKGVDMLNEDELADRLNSQIDPVTISSPVGEVLGSAKIGGGSQYYIKLYPISGYTGKVVFLRRPVKPNFVYSVVSGRVIVYNDTASTQLEWPENWINAVLLKALESIGINLTSAEVSQFAETHAMQNFQNVNRT